MSPTDAVDLSTLSGAPRQGSPASPQRPVVARCRIERAPTDSADSLTISLIGYPSSRTWTVPAKQWEPKAGPVLPLAGDTGCALFDHRGDAWLVAYATMGA